ncbi:hypothetical protein FUAX_51730 (plasmid) [Fulvitalea axinellae]|uniref:Uncharacterized protein n=1 Tax=Fulvitalea axinellae TaxID=1182444 RepID=A0AAU9CL38_9BACT|nr:hypothetical protein FUAX_51730 [Fulvitalea axinellae]
MKRAFLLYLIGLCLSFVAEAKKFDGVIINGDDTVAVTFIFPVADSLDRSFYRRIQSRIRYIDGNGKRRMLRPRNAEEICFRFYSKEIRMMSVSNTLGLGSVFATDSRIFLRLKEDGALRLYSYYSSATQTEDGATAGGTYDIEEFILNRGATSFKVPYNWSFTEKMTEFFNDCPGLALLISAGDLRREDIHVIVRMYNEKCGG